MKKDTSSILLTILFLTLFMAVQPRGTSTGNRPIRNRCSGNSSSAVFSGTVPGGKHPGARPRTDHGARHPRGPLSSACPRIVNIHGGIYPSTYACLLSEFLIGMGYPEEKIRNPGDGSFSFSCYESSEKIAGASHGITRRRGYGHGHRPQPGRHPGCQNPPRAWWNLHKSVRVWDPLTGSFEERDWIIDRSWGEADGRRNPSFLRHGGWGGRIHTLSAQSMGDD